MGGKGTGMNVNPLITALKGKTGIEVVPDYYEGAADKWIAFTYEDERPAQKGDNAVTWDIAYIQVSLFTPGKFNYMSLKETIKTYLESIGIVTNVQSWTYKDKEQMIRQTTFNVEIEKERL